MHFVYTLQPCVCTSLDLSCKKLLSCILILISEQENLILIKTIKAVFFGHRDSGLIVIMISAKTCFCFVFKVKLEDCCCEYFTQTASLLVNLSVNNFNRQTFVLRLHVKLEQHLNHSAADLLISGAEPHVRFWSGISLA